MSLENTHDIGKVKIVMVGAGGGGASSLSDLSDTNIVNPLNGQLLGYNSLTGKWGNVNGGGGGGDSYAGLGIGKKKTVTSGVIDTDIELHRAPIVGDRLLVWFDAGVDSPTGIITYNNGTAVTSNVESVSLLSYKNGWNIFEFKNDGLLYINCWVRVQNVPIPNNTLSGLSDTQISTTPTDGQVLTFDGDNNKWKNMALPTVQANTGTANAELKKLKIGNVVYNADSVKHYDVSAISNGAISVSVPNAGHLDGEIIAVNTGAYTGTTSSAWTLSLSDGQTMEALTMSKGGSAYTDAITANCLLFVKCDIGNSTAVVLGIAGAGTTVQANPTGTPTSYLDKLKVGNGVYDTSAIKPCNVSSITSSTTGVISLPVVDTNIVGKIIAVSTGAYSGTTTNAWALSLTSGGSQVPIAMSKADGTAFTDELTANELLLVYVDTTIDHEQAIVLDIPVNTTEIKTATGNPITLTDAIAGNAIEASAEIVASQSGSGTPSPTNVRPISGFSSVTITREDAQGQTATVTVSLGSTVYGGTLDLTSGELTVTHAILSENDLSSFNIGPSAGGLSLAQFDVSAVMGADIYCNMFEQKDGSAGYNSTTFCVSATNEGAQIRVYSDATSSSDFKTKYAGLQIVYELATPTTTTLTAAQLALVKGYNQLSCNSGDMEITYKASGLDALKERVDELEDAVADLETDMASKTDTSVVGPVESGTTASQAYAVGEHFIRNDKFCTAIAAIASGATLTLNTNYVEGTIADAIANKYNYSATEHVVGTWIDGSTVYEKTIDFGAMPNQTTKSVDAGLPSGAKVIKMFGTTADSSWTSVFPLPYVDATTGANFNFQLWYANGYVSVKTTTAQSHMANSYITIQYIKSSS